MNLRFDPRLFSISFLFTLCFLAGTSSAQTQQNAGAAEKNETPKIERPSDGDVVILANVTAKELKFEVVPNPTVEFPGNSERKNVWESDRQNLPAQVEPGVVYRNIGIQLRIVSRLADIERIVAEALGEIPVDTESTKNTDQSANPSKGKIPLKN